MGQVAYDESPQASGWVGWIMFAAVMMTVSGTLNLFYGVIAAINDEWVVWGNQANLYLDISEWGWVHIIMGTVVLLSGLALFSGNILARTVGVLVAALSIMANFFWLPAYPLWSIIVITLNVIVIYALTAHGREMQAAG